MNTKPLKSFINLAMLALLAYLSSAYSAVVDTTASNSAFQYLDVPPSPRQVAMGVAGTALGTGGFAYFNPASPAIDTKTNLSVGYAPLPGDYSIAHAQGSCMISDFFVGANITNHVVSGIIPTNYNHDPDYNTPFSYDGFQFSLDGGYRAGRLGVGISVSGLQEQIGTATAYGISAGAGLIYNANANLTIGAAGLHLGSTTGFTDDTRRLGQGYALPRSARAGAAYCDTLFRMPFTAAADIVYRDVGLKVTKLSQLTTRVFVPAGIEVWPTSYVAVRLGKRFNDESGVFTFGAGLRWSMLTFDLAFALVKLVTDYEVQPYFGLTYGIPHDGARPARDVSKVKHAALPGPGIIEKPAQAVTAPLPKPAAPVADSLTASPAQSASPIAAPNDSTQIVPVPSGDTKQ
jgi:hypothetical protein